MAKEWKAVSEEEKKACEEIATQNKLIYEEAMKAYQAAQVQAGTLGALVDAGGHAEASL